MNKEDIKFLMTMWKKKPDEINAMCDTGMFNDIIEGYCRIVFNDLGLSDKLSDYSFSRLFDEVSAEEARVFDGDVPF